ncbi:MAG: DUF4177 domain-containing protein [Myxococcales bacterium]|nr:DUF4177 domain-containing protein [Myxococcales bacterium]
MDVEYKYVETSLVTDDELTRLVNHWCGEGWRYEGAQFAMREASKRPAMAFLLFTRPARATNSDQSGVD